MKKQSAVKIVLYILYILSGAYTAFGIFKYSYPPTVVREAVAGFLSKLGVDIGVTGSEIIYHFLLTDPRRKSCIFVLPLLPFQ